MCDLDGGAFSQRLHGDGGRRARERQRIFRTAERESARMSKRGQETQGGEERYGFTNGPGGGDMADRPQQANAAQMARRK